MGLRKLAQELLILILEELDPESLRRFCQISRRALAIVMDIKALRYQFELALSGMKDGPSSDFSSSDRLEHLLNHKKALPALCWSHEENFQIPISAMVGVSGGYFYHASPIAFQFLLELYELPCFRIAPVHPCRRRLKYTVPFVIRSVTVDATQDLLVIGGVFQLNESIFVRLHFQKLLLDTTHHPTSLGEVTFNLNWGDDPEHTVSLDQVEICGRIVGISISLEIGQERTGKFALVDWRTGQSIMWISEVLSFQFLDSTRVLVVIQPEDDEDDEEESETEFRKPYRPSPSTDARSPILAIHNVSDLRKSEDAQIRMYQLPDSWNNAVSIDIKPNISPKEDSHIIVGTLFYPDPAHRIFVILVTFHLDRVPVGYWPRSVVIVNDSIFKSAGPDDISDVPWSRWRRHCLIRELSHGARSLHVVGSRLLFSEEVPECGNPIYTSHAPRSRIRLVDFNPHAVECIRPNTRSAAPWTWKGPWTTITAVEPLRSMPHVRTRTVDSYEISKFYATEDNLILLVVCRDAPGALVRVLTFNELPACLSPGNQG